LTQSCPADSYLSGLWLKVVLASLASFARLILMGWFVLR